MLYDGSHLCDLVVFSKKPEHLRVTFLGSIGLRPNGGSIISSRLCVTNSTRPCTAVMIVCEEAHWGESFGIVRSYWGQDDEDFCCLGLGHTKVWVRANGSGPNVQRKALPIRDPVSVNLHFESIGGHMEMYWVLR